MLTMIQPQIKNPSKIIGTLQGNQLSISFDAKENEGNQITLTFINKENHNRYEGIYKYSDLDKTFVAVFDSLAEIYDQIYESIKKQDEYLKIQSDGTIKIGYTIGKNKNIKYLELHTQLQQGNYISKVTKKVQIIDLQVKQAHKQILQVKNQIKAMKAQFIAQEKQKQLYQKEIAIRDTQIQKLKQQFVSNKELMEQKMKNQLQQLKQELLNTINKDEAKSIISSIEHKQKTDIQTIQNDYQERFKIANKQLQEIKRKMRITQKQVEQYKSLVKNTTNLFPVNFKVIQKLQKESSIKIEFNKSIYKRISVYPNTGLTAFAKNYHLSGKTIERVKNNNSIWSQVVGSSTISRSGKCYFELECISSYNNMPCVGIITASLVHQESAYASNDAISYYSRDGRLYGVPSCFESGGKGIYGSHGLIGVYLDWDNKLISWCIDGQHQYTCKIPQNFHNKNVYPFMETYNDNSKYEFK